MTRHVVEVMVTYRAVVAVPEDVDLDTNERFYEAAVEAVQQDEYIVDTEVNYLRAGRDAPTQVRLCANQSHPTLVDAEHL